MHWFHLSTILLAISAVSGQKGRFTGSERMPDIPRQNSCKIETILQSPQKAAFCNHWPDKKELTSEVVELTIHRASLRTLTESAISELGLKLNVLRLTECGIQNLQPNTFQNQETLKILDLSHNQLTTIPQTIFQQNRNLKEIRLRQNRLSTINRGAFAQLDSLDILDLSGNELKQIPVDLPRNLKQLNLEQNQITEMTAMQLPNLHTLNICDNSISLFTENIVSFSKLEVLCIGNKELRKDSTGFKMLTNLKELTLKGKATVNAKLATELMPIIGSCQQLTTLRIQEYSLESLSIISGFKFLRVLVLQSVSIQQTPTPSLFRGCPNLNTIDLKGSNELAQTLLQNQDVLKSWLNIKYLSVKDCGIDTLDWFPMPSPSRPSGPLPMPSLTAIDISDNNLDCDDQSTKTALCHLKSMTKNFTIYEPSPRILNRDKETTQKTLPWYEQNIMGMHNPDDTKCKNGESVRQMNYDDCPIIPTGSPFQPGIKSGDDLEGTAPTEEIPGTQQELRQEEIWYIVLGVLLLVLVIIAIVLAIVCYRVKRRGTETIPETGTSKGVQSFQKLQQASSEDALLDSSKTQRK